MDNIGCNFAWYGRRSLSSCRRRPVSTSYPQNLRIIAIVFFAIFCGIWVPSLAAQIPTAPQALQKLSNEISAVDKDIYALNRKTFGINKELARLEKKEANLRQKLSNDLNSFNQTAVTIARLERIPLQAMLLSDSWRGGHMRQGVTTQGRRSLSNNISQSRQQIESLQDIWEDKTQKLAEISDIQSELKKQKASLEKLFLQQLEHLKLTDQQRKRLTEQAFNSQKTGKFSQLFSSKQYSQAILPPKIRKTYKRLPTQGKVVTDYKQKNAMGITSKGLIIRSQAGSDVTALADGRIIFAGNFRNYGYMVILEHGLETHSLYSGLQGSNHKVGDFIRADSPLGILPNSPAPELYVEVRKNGEAINPRPWLEQH